MVWCGEWYKQTIIWVQCVWIARCSTFSDLDDISKLCAFSIHGAERWYVNWMKMCTHHGIQTEQSLIQHEFNHRIWLSWFREKENEEVKTNSSHMKWTETNGYSLLSCSCSIGIHPQSRQRRHTQSIVVNSMRYDEIRFKSNWIFPLGNSLLSSSVGGSCCGEKRRKKNHSTHERPNKQKKNQRIMAQWWIQLWRIDTNHNNNNNNSTIGLWTEQRARKQALPTQCLYNITQWDCVSLTPYRHARNI